MNLSQNNHENTRHGSPETEGYSKQLHLFRQPIAHFMRIINGKEGHDEQYS